MTIDPTKVDRNHNTASLPNIIQTLLQTNTVWLAGGAARSVWCGTPITDYDLFFKSRDDAYATITTLQHLGGLQVSYVCPKGELVTLQGLDAPVQCICKYYYQDDHDLLSTFDFTACCGLITPEGKVQWLPRCQRDVEERVLRLNNLMAPLATLNRTKKYRKYGFSGNIEFQVVEWLIRYPDLDYDMALYID